MINKDALFYKRRILIIDDDKINSKFLARMLEKKDFVGHKAYGTTYEYFPLVNKEDYAKVHFNDFMKNYFNNSFPQMAAFFARENNMDMKNLEDILKMTEEEINKSKGNKDE